MSAQDPDRAPPPGVTSALFLAASELVGCREFFRAGGKSFGKLVKAVVKATDATKKKHGMMDRFTSFLGTAFAGPDTFGQVHGLLMLTSLVFIFFSTAWRRGCAGPRKVLEGLPLVAFCAVLVGLHAATLARGWQKVTSEKLAVSLQMPLRAAGLVLADPPSEQGVGSSFYAFQFASLMAQFSAEILDGGAVELSRVFRQPALAVNSGTLGALAPVAVALLWLLALFLRQPHGLFRAAFLSVFSMPQTLGILWPRVPQLLGYGPQDLSGLVTLLTTLHAGSALCLLMSSGAFAIVSVMMMGQVLLRIHGEGPLRELLGSAAK